MSVVSRALCGVALGLVALLAGHHSTAATKPAEIPVEDFFRVPAIMRPTLSPDGKRIAMLVPTAEGRKGLAVARVETPKKFVGIAQFSDADVGSVQWVNNERLIFSAAQMDAAVADRLDGGLYAINADGTEYKWLIERGYATHTVGATSGTKPLPNRFRLHSLPRDGSDDVLVQQFYEFSGDQNVDPTSRLVRLNTKDMTYKVLPAGDVPPSTVEWLADPKGMPAIAMSTNRKSEMAVSWRSWKGTWEELARFDIFDRSESRIEPVAVDYDGTLLVLAYSGNAEQTKALYRYNPTTRQRAAQPLVTIAGFDFDGAPIFDRASKKLLGFQFLAETAGQVWLDADMKALQAAVDKLLPNTNNLIQCTSACTSADHHIVTAASDRQPPTYFLYERANNKLTFLGATYPWLDSRLLATQEYLRIKARDGMELPLYYTKPQGKGPFPTVALVHGGPFVRGHQWGFSPEAQFLASRGYLVLEVDFRGSEGYGDRHQRAGWKQWGLAMQDDVTDAVRWAIGQGLADAKRIAIAGASYGGYATMMGLVKEPELFKAGINWVGVTDIELMYEVGWSDFMGGKWMRYGMPKMVGDPKADAAQLANTSPLKRAAEIKQPVLMAYGEMDARVPLPHGKKMLEALKKAGNQDVELIVYEGEGHGFGLAKNRFDFYRRMEAFLAKHLN